MRASNRPSTATRSSRRASTPATPPNARTPLCWIRLVLCSNGAAPSILDASFLRRDHRRRAARLAKDTGAQFACLYLEIDDATARARIEQRVKEGGDPSDARWLVYRGQKRRLQKPSEVPLDRLVTLDASRPVAHQRRSAIKALRAISPLSLAIG